jgi:hypothetical protein
VVEARGLRQRALLGEHVHGQVGAAAGERVADEACGVLFVVADDGDAHRAASMPEIWSGTRLF